MINNNSHHTYVQVLVVANPANTNALILKENAPSIPAENITCLTRLDHNRALGQVRPPGTLSQGLFMLLNAATPVTCAYVGGRHCLEASSGP